MTSGRELRRPKLVPSRSDPASRQRLVANGLTAAPTLRSSTLDLRRRVAYRCAVPAQARRETPPRSLLETPNEPSKRQSHSRHRRARANVLPVMGFDSDIYRHMTGWRTSSIQSRASNASSSSLFGMYFGGALVEPGSTSSKT